MLSQTQTQDDEYRLFTDSTISYMGDSLVEEKLKKNLMVEPTISEALPLMAITHWSGLLAVVVYCITQCYFFKGISYYSLTL